MGLTTEQLEGMKTKVVALKTAYRKSTTGEEKDRIQADLMKLFDEFNSGAADINKADDRESEFLIFDTSKNKASAYDKVMSIRKGSAAYNDQIAEAQKINDHLFLQASLISKIRGYSFDSVMKRLPLWDQWTKGASVSKLRKALDTAGATNWIPTGFSERMSEIVRLELRVAANFEEFAMPTNPWTLPIEGTDAIAYLVPETTSDDLNDNASKPISSTPSTRKVTFTTSKLAARAIINDEANEDSIINLIDYYEKKIAGAIADAVENATLNGSTAVTHPDNDVEVDANTTKRNERAWDGFRQLIEDAGAGGGAQWADAGGTLTQTKVREARAKLGKYGVNPERVGVFASVTGWLAMMDETNFPNVQTIDKFGNDAVIKTGVLARIDGMPIFQSEFQRDDVSATGFNTVGGPNNLSTLALINVDSYAYGSRRETSLDVVKNVETDKHVVIAKIRRDAQVTQPAGAGFTYAAGVFNF